ncbi:pectinesterase inhibitor 10-like [Spodoptera litura]|uniref:Pectinesterase inhibitor 10-like n=1 Tax=Spodoptera litura TaxID=69820 RepID=A0A9J7EPL5_SPOLT|nr:pectinesterase inhibitor 10-like [Spodoptera litura]
MSALDDLPDVVSFFGVDLKTGALIVAAIGVVHPMAYGCTCFTPISYLIVTIWILVALFFAASVALFSGIVNDDALLCTIWIWYTLIFVVIMLMLMTLLALLFTSRRQRSRVFVAILGMLWYVLTIYFILVVNSHRKALSKAETESATKAPPAGGPVESGNEPTSDAPSGDASPTDSPTGDATTADASAPDAPSSDATPSDAPSSDASSDDPPSKEPPSDEPPPDEPPPDNSPDSRKALRKSGHGKAALARLTTATAAKPMLQCTMVPTIRHKKGQRLHQYKKKETIRSNDAYTTFHQG